MEYENTPHKTNFICEHSKSSIIINDEYPHGMSVIAEGYDYQCPKCRELVSTQYWVDMN